MKRTFSSIRVIALGYAAVVLIGTALLALPVASVQQGSAGIPDALFTAVSASCVTGLVVRNTATDWTAFGQTVILVLIQIGGLGFMTIATGFSMLLRRRLGLRERQIMQESINVDNIGKIASLTKMILRGTALCEGVGALLLALRFVPRFGLRHGLWLSVFHSISAFCNAGFDLLGSQTPYCSFVDYADDALVTLTLCALIIVGGLGFIVWEDLMRHRLRFARYSLHTKLVLSVSALLTFGCALLFLLFERNATNGDAGMKQALLASLFDSVTARTAGFNTVDTASLSNAGKFLTILLMYVGGSPGSTAGGIKTTTVAVIAISTFNGIRRREFKGIFGRRFESDALSKAISVAFTNLALAMLGVLAIFALQPALHFSDVVFEVMSAIGTVGMSTGVTRDLLPASRLIIVFLMFCGRVGSVSFALALLEKRASPAIMNPREKITLG